MNDVSPDVVRFSEMELLRQLPSRGRRPNVLVLCPNARPEDVLEQLREICQAPLHVRQLPGPLDLPTDAPGTLVLSDAPALTVSQQFAVADWIKRTRGSMQIVSLSRIDLHARVMDGRFLESLFYMLNIVTVRTSGRTRRTRP